MILGYSFRKVAIIGVGLIGGSIGMAIKKNRLAREVVGISLHQASANAALKNQAIDHIAHDVSKAVKNADLVILATPVNTILKLLPEISKSVRRGCVVTDVGSTKQAIVEMAQQCLTSAHFVGAHPLAGSEKKGPSFASADLFQDSVCVLTPTDKTNRMAKERIRKLWSRLGAKITYMSPQEHDEILAFISHLPHLLAYGLMETIPPPFLAYASQGLKDTSRIAASSPPMWRDICKSNAKNILKALDEMVKNLSLMRKAIIAKDEQRLVDIFKRAKSKRDGIN